MKPSSKRVHVCPRPVQTSEVVICPLFVHLFLGATIFLQIKLGFGILEPPHFIPTFSLSPMADAHCEWAPAHSRWGGAGAPGPPQPHRRPHPLRIPPGLRLQRRPRVPGPVTPPPPTLHPRITVTAPPPPVADAPPSRWLVYVASTLPLLITTERCIHTATCVSFATWKSLWFGGLVEDLLRSPSHFCASVRLIPNVRRIPKCSPGLECLWCCP